MASTTVKAERLSCQGKPVSRDSDGSVNLDYRLLVLLRAAIDTAPGPDGRPWKHEALASHLGLPNGSYLSRMLNGGPDGKPWKLHHFVRLPIEIKRELVKRVASSVGLICVEPLDHDAAVQQCVAGLLSLLVPRPQAVKVDVRVEQNVKIA